MVEVFRDRLHAGRLLGEKLLSLRKSWEKAIVLGIPRGGVVTAKAVAEKLGVPLNAIVSRKLRAPGNPELGIGAVSEYDALWINQGLVEELGISEEYLNQEISFQRKRVSEYVAKFRGGLALQIPGLDAIIVDDGIATGATVIVAAIAARRAGASRVIIATPVISDDVVSLVREYCDELVWVYKPLLLYAVGMYYQDFSEVTDEQVVDILKHLQPS
ncbi:MAG: phosphoribosyltransferase [Infirmifilum sp.]|jgi:putative phosphoribosyl transferase|uniref:phosphoribosyltransferase n=1 Tax=Infirmifilum TaxID=2856573 RepID=UPI003C78ACD1